MISLRTGKMKQGFNSEKYLELQYQNIQKKIGLFDEKLYMEFGGKLFDDLHASRVLPGFEPNAKIKLLKKLKNISEIIIVVSAQSLQENKVRADFNLTYGDEVLRLIDNLRSEGLEVSGVVITMFKGQPTAQMFGKKLENRNERVYYHTYTKGYPHDLETVVSDSGYGANPFIKTTKKLVVITAPGPNSGKLATALSQLYHEHKNGVKAGYAKYETFPVWNLPLHHPVNLAYEAATADLADENQIDTFHLESYGITSVNYNRDLAAFPLLKTILTKITGQNAFYKSPTDMGVNMIASAVYDDEAVQNASKQEIIRRYFRSLCDEKKGLIDISVFRRVEALMDKLNISTNDRKVAKYALQKQQETSSHIFALELENGEIVTGRTKTLSAVSACILNVIKKLSGIEDAYHLIPESIIKPILKLNKHILGERNELLSLKDILLALSVSGATNNKAQKALEALKHLKGLEAHSTYILSPQDEETIKKLGILVTSEPIYPSNKLFE